MKVLEFPLTKITGCFVFGIVVAYYTKPPFLLIFISLLASVLLLFLSYYYFNTEIKRKPYFGIATFCTSFCIGAFTLISDNQTLNPNHYTHQLTDKEKENCCKIIIKEKLKSSSNHVRYSARIVKLNNKLSYGKIILNIKKDSLPSEIEIESSLEVTGSIYKNRKPANPNQFDYGKYLENKQIYAQMYAGVENIKINSERVKTITYFASKLRNKIIHNLEKNHFNRTELSVVAALILGQQQDISKEVLRDYQYAGAIHILSVSGLHVGFILLFITYLLKPIPNTKKGALLKVTIVIASLWSFGILAGLAPSVVRSVTMFSFVSVGMFLRRSINIYHTLLISAFLILLFEPSFLFDVGFQLSYIALFFIIWLQPLLASIWTPKHKITSYFWEIITVSFAAQIGTFPLSIYYFHQFPGLFFLTNIVILPALSLILGLGVLVMILAAFDFVWIPLLKMLEWSIWLLDKVIAWVASFEDFIFKDVPLNSYMMLTWYLLLFSWIIFLKKPNFKKLVLSLCAVIILQTITFQSKYTNQKESEFIVFNKYKNTVITERTGDKIILNSTDSLIKNTDKNLDLKAYLVANFCKIEKKKILKNVYYFNNKRILVIDSAAVYLSEEVPDVLILTNSPKLNLERLFKLWKPNQVVVDATNYKTYVKVWKATCNKEKIPFHDTAEKGFYKL
jgi:competence protein ComEC